MAELGPDRPRGGAPPRAFTPGIPELGAFPFELWGRLLARAWRRPPEALARHGDPAGHRPLREAIARYLCAVRALRCDWTQVIVTSGAQQGLDLAARLLLDSRTGTSLRDSVLELWTEAGLDLETVFAELAKERDVLKGKVQRTGGARGPLHNFVLPTMQAIGLLSERIAGHFQEMFEHSNRGGYSGTVIKNISDLPDDLEQWVMSEEP